MPYLIPYTPTNPINVGQQAPICIVILFIMCFHKIHAAGPVREGGIGGISTVEHSEKSRPAGGSRMPENGVARGRQEAAPAPGKARRNAQGWRNRRRPTPGLREWQYGSEQAQPAAQRQVSYGGGDTGVAIREWRTHAAGAAPARPDAGNINEASR
jgi:hypothetical protein